MQSSDTIRWSGKIDILTQYGNGKYEKETIHNTIMLDAKNLLRNCLTSNTPVGAKIAYVALGSGTTSVSNSQHQLASEQLRKTITSQASPSDGVTTNTVYVAAYEANTFTIEELGWFAGTLATAATNSGVMIARILWHHAKTNLESVTIVRTDTIS